MRVVEPSGVIIAAVPGPRHLIQLKAEIYDEVRLHEMRQEQPDGFSSIETVELHYPIAQRGNEAVALLQMTPLRGVHGPTSGNVSRKLHCLLVKPIFVFIFGVAISQKNDPKESDSQCRSTPAPQNFNTFSQ